MAQLKEVDVSLEVSLGLGTPYKDVKKIKLQSYSSDVPLILEALKYLITRNNGLKKKNLFPKKPMNLVDPYIHEDIVQSNKELDKYEKEIDPMYASYLLSLWIYSFKKTKSRIIRS